MAQENKLKIGLVLDTSLDQTDGVPQYVTILGEWLRSQGHNVHYLVGQTKRQDLPNIHSLSHNINVRFNANRASIPLPASRRKLKQVVKNENFDVLHVQSPHHPLMAQWLILAADSKTAVIGTFHILPYGWMSRLGNKLLGTALRPSLKRIDKMLAVSAAAQDFCLESFGIKAEVVPNVVDHARFNKDEPLPQYDDGKINILFLGRLVKRKGCQVLLQAVAELAKEQKLPEFRVIICGRGELQKQLEEYVTVNGLEQIVEFTGFVSEQDKPRYYASADIAVFPSSGGESFGIVLIEAMASGRSAVLAGDNPGYRSVMSPKPILLFPPKDIHELTAKLKQYINNAGEREAMAAWGSEYSKSFDVNVVGNHLLDIYKQTLRKRRNK